MRTHWYSGHQHPVREGWYERDYTSIFGGGNDPLPHVHLDLWLQKSPGDGFWYVDEPKGQINDAYYECLPWRGLSSNVEFSGTPAALSPEAPLERRVGGAVPSAPTFGKGET